jgi:hypothetical protein
MKNVNWFFVGYLLLIIVMAAIIFSSTGCEVYNKSLMDITYSFERAIIALPNGDVVDGDVTSWLDFEDGDQIQVKIDGKTYLVHSEDIVLISE